MLCKKLYMLKVGSRAVAVWVRHMGPAGRRLETRTGVNVAFRVQLVLENLPDFTISKVLTYIH